MKKRDDVKESLKKLEEIIVKAVEFVESSIDAMRQEIAFINQKVSDLESRLDRMEVWPRIGEGNVSEVSEKLGEVAETSTQSTKRAPIYDEAPVVKPERHPVTPVMEMAEGGARGGIVEEQFVRPSAFLKKMSELESSISQTYSSPTVNPRLQISSVLSSMRGESRPPSVAVAARPVSLGWHPSPSQETSAEEKTVKLPDNWLPDCSRAKHYNPKNLNKGILKDMEKKTKDIFVR